MTDSTRAIRLFLTDIHDCSYLTEQEARTAFIDPDVSISPEQYSALNQMGFRRSGMHFYRSQCDNCQQCQPLRVNVNDFSARRRHKRIIKRNQHLTVVQQQDISEHYPLYENYINQRHHDGDMFPPSEKQFHDFLGTNQYGQYSCFYDQDKLIMVTQVDQLEDGLSLVYTFFDTNYEKNSLGTYSILWHLQHCQSQALPYLYLGLWIKDSPKMQYKTDFRPNERFKGNKWQLFQTK